MPFGNALGRRRRRRAPSMLVLIVAFAAVAAVAAILQPPRRVDMVLSGAPAVVDGDTVAFSDPPTRVRLRGIDAPELGQTCQDGAGAEWACGRHAQAVLR